MAEEKNFKFVLIKTHVLKIHIHCEGCMHKVKKLLRKIEGVYEVKIETGEHKVSVTGNVDCTTVIKKLVKSGKHAEVWSPKNDDHGEEEEDLSHLTSSECHEPRYPCDEVFPSLWSLESYLNNFNHGGEKQHMHSLSEPDYDAPPQFHGLPNSNVLLPLYQRPLAMMYNMQAPWYNHPHSMTYTNMHKNMGPVIDEEMLTFNGFSDQNTDSP